SPRPGTTTMTPGQPSPLSPGSAKPTPTSSTSACSSAWTTNGTAAGDDSNPTSRPPQNKSSTASSTVPLTRPGPTFTPTAGAKTLDETQTPQVRASKVRTGYPEERLQRSATRQGADGLLLPRAERSVHRPARRHRAKHPSARFWRLYRWTVFQSVINRSQSVDMGWFACESGALSACPW